MRVPRAFALLGAIAIAGSCSGGTAKPIQSEQWKLPTGRTVRPLQVLRSLPDIDPPFLLLATLSPVRIALRREVAKRLQLDDMFAILWASSRYLGRDKRI